MNEATLSPGEKRRRAATARLGLRLEHAYKFHDLLAASMSLEHGGFAAFAPITSLKTRADASDLLLTAADAVQANVVEAALHARSYAEWVGPHGQTMPGPHSTLDDQFDDIRAENDLVGFFRAFGSTLDCLAACAIGVLQLPFSIKSADAGLVASLDRRMEGHWPDSEDHASWIHRAHDVVATARADPEGWLEWSIEMRNRVIHRSRQLTTWLPKVSGRQGPQLQVLTNEDPARLMRFEPHLRRSPWLSELEALTAPGGVSVQFLPEPAPATLEGLLGNLNALIENVLAILVDCWEASEREGWGSPESAWTGSSSTKRTASASAFSGFDPGYYVPPLSELRVSGRDAVRLQIAEELRQADES